MALIKEFRGLRASADMISRVAELPYDVLDSEEARVIADKNPTSFFHVSKPEVDLPAGTDLYSDIVYETAAKNFRSFIDKGVLSEDKDARMYLYTLVMNGRAQTGLMACVSIDDYISGVVKKHEFTREDKERDRIRHMEALNAHVGLVFLLYREDGSVRSLLAKALEKNPEYDFTADDGVRHIVRVIDDPELVAKLKNIFSGRSLYIADGHHRAASAVRVGLNHREKAKTADPDAEYNWFLSVMFPHDELLIMPYNRVVKDLNGLDDPAFLAKVGENFKVTEGTPSPLRKGTFSMYLGKKWYHVEPLFSLPVDPVASLDVSVLQDKILSPLLGIGNPRTDKRINFIGGIRGADELVKLVDAGEYAVAFSMHPTTVDDLMAVSDSGNVMPPKSTWFEPKLRSGLVIHRI
jgi:uncharacterized protein (DUF1015 family)